MLIWFLCGSVLASCALWIFLSHKGLPGANEAEILFNVLEMVAFAYVHAPLLAGYFAAWVAYLVWKWWNGTGGKGLRRALRRLFRPVRRTAPAAG